jgi:hypothetical protein
MLGETIMLVKLASRPAANLSPSQSVVLVVNGTPRLHQPWMMIPIAHLAPKIIFKDREVKHTKSRVVRRDRNFVHFYAHQKAKNGKIPI